MLVNIQFDFLNIGRYTNFHQYFGALVFSPVCTKFILSENLRILLKLVQQNFSCLANILANNFQVLLCTFCLVTLIYFVSYAAVSRDYKQSTPFVVSSRLFLFRKT